MDVAYNVEAAEALGLVYDSTHGDFVEFDLDQNHQAAMAQLPAAEAAAPAAAAADVQSDPETDDADDEVVRAADKQALREIRQYQKSTDELLSTVAFERIADDVLQKHVRARGLDLGYSLDPLALATLQHAADAHLVETLELRNMCATHASRVKLTQADMADI
jgi:histone H3/H4